MRFSRDPGRRGRGQLVLDMAPLVDIVFQLLIFFLLAASFQRNPVLDINLPKASAKPQVQPKGAVTVYVLEEGRPDRFRVDEEVVTEEGLADVLEARFAADPSAVLLIQADERVPHGDVVKVMSVGQAVGFVRQGIVGRPEEGAGEGPASP